MGMHQTSRRGRELDPAQVTPGSDVSLFVERPRPAPGQGQVIVHSTLVLPGEVVPGREAGPDAGTARPGGAGLAGGSRVAARTSRSAGTGGSGGPGGTDTGTGGSSRTATTEVDRRVSGARPWPAAVWVVAALVVVGALLAVTARVVTAAATPQRAQRPAAAAPAVLAAAPLPSLDPTVPGGAAAAGTTGPVEVGTCSASLAVDAWPGGFVGRVKVVADGPLSGWRVRLELPPGVRITRMWSGTRSGDSGRVTVRSVHYNHVLADAGTADFGYQATGRSNGTVLRCTADGQKGAVRQ